MQNCGITLSQFPQTFLTNPSKLRIYGIMPMQNSHCDLRNFDSVNHFLEKYVRFASVVTMDHQRKASLGNVSNLE
jgi:hypothetical protein